jgi:hypothetical protein
MVCVAMPQEMGEGGEGGGGKKGNSKKWESGAG